MKKVQALALILLSTSFGYSLNAFFNSLTAGVQWKITWSCISMAIFLGLIIAVLVAMKNSK